MNNENEFQVGDEVEIIKDGEDNLSGKSIGYKFVIKQVYKGVWGPVYYREFEGSANGVCGDYLKLVKRDFNKGDKVKIKDTANVRRFNPKAVGEVISLSQDDADELNQEEEDGRYTLANNKFGVNFCREDLELLQPTLKRRLFNRREFKKGDRVEIVKSCLDELIGVKGWVDKVVGDEVYAKWDDDGKLSRMPADSLKLVEKKSLSESMNIVSGETIRACVKIMEQNQDVHENFYHNHLNNSLRLSVIPPHFWDGPLPTIQMIDYGYGFKPKVVKKKGFIMRKLENLSNAIRRLLNPRMEKFYKVEFIDNELNFTSLGREAQRDIVDTALLNGEDITFKQVGDALEKLADKMIADCEACKK